MRQSKRKGVSISFITIISFVITIMLSMVLVSSLYMVSSRYSEVRSSMDDYISWKTAASNVKTASDYLTEQARSYAVTEEEEYLQNYFDEAYITKRREKALETIGEKLSNTSAYQSLESAINESMNLMVVEYHSMQLVLSAKGESVPQYASVLNNYPLSAEELALSIEEKKDLAVELVYDENYSHYKNRINTGVTIAIISLDNIMEENVRSSSKALERTILLQQIIIISLVFFLAALCVLVYIFIVLPVRRMVNGLLVGRPLDEKGVREYRYLANAYNQTREANIADEEKLLYQAEHDQLTELYNRAGYDHIYKRMDLDATAYLLIDIDNFKGINDKRGHAAGDKVLAKVGHVLKRVLEDSGFICRIGGDEFAVLMPDTTKDDYDFINDSVNQINNILKSQDKDSSIEVSLSFGLAFGTSNDNCDTLYRKADKALYITKNNGRGFLSVYHNNPSKEE